MTTSTHKRVSKKLLGELQQARQRLAKVKSALVLAKEQARLARRRRKEAKAVARRAKKQARLARKEVVEAELILAETESRVARASKPAPRTRIRKRGITKAAAATRQKKTSPRVAKRRPYPGQSPAPGVVKPKRSKSRRTRRAPRPKLLKRPIHLKTAQEKLPAPVPEPPELEALAPPSSSPARQGPVQPEQSGAGQGDDTETPEPFKPPGPVSTD